MKMMKPAREGRAFAQNVINVTMQAPARSPSPPAHTGEAIAYALNRLDRHACLGCRHFAFRECAQFTKGLSGSPIETEPAASR